MKITRFKKEVPECNSKWFLCKHKTCELWAKGYGVALWKFWFIKFLVWRKPNYYASKKGIFNY